MPTDSSPRTVLLITGDHEGCVPLTQAFLTAAPNVRLSSVKGVGEGMEYLCGARDYADRTAYPTPQVILLDPDKEPAEALEVLGWLKEKPSLRGIPVVLLTSMKDARVIDQAYALGANSCLRKSADEQAAYDLATGIGTYATLVQT